jgi:hypothetical protein
MVAAYNVNVFGKCPFSINGIYLKLSTAYSLLAAHKIASYHADPVKF